MDNESNHEELHTPPLTPRKLLECIRVVQASDEVPDVSRVPWYYAAHNDAKTFIDSRGYVRDSTFPKSIVQSILALPGFTMAAYIGKPAVRLYLNALLWELFKTQADRHSRRRGRRVALSKEFVSRFATELMSMLEQKGFSIPFKLPALEHYANEGMEPDFREWSAELEKLTGHIADDGAEE